MTRTNPSYAEALGLASRLTEPAIRQAIRDLELPQGSRGLDAGCGIGSRGRWLVDAVGPTGAVVGLDISPDQLRAARSTAHEGRFTDRLVAGDVVRPPFLRSSFDWVWSADTLWPGLVARNPLAAARELAGLVRDGGRMALVFCAGQSLLCGHPVLEASLTHAFSQATDYLAGVPPEQQAMRTLGWLREAGLGDLRAHTYLAELQGPLTRAQREGVAFWCDMLWGELEGRVPAADWEEYLRLCGAGADAPLFLEPGYYGFVTYTCFEGRRAGR